MLQGLEILNARIEMAGGFEYMGDVKGSFTHLCLPLEFVRTS